MQRRSVRFGMPRAMRSKKGRASSGPGAASGWNWTRREAVAREPLDGAVVERDVADLGGVRRLDGEAVVLRGHEHAADARTRTGWFAPRWPNGSLNVRRPSASASELMAEADAEERHAAEQLADRLDLAGELRRIARAVADEHGARARARGSRPRPRCPGTTTASTPAPRGGATIERLQPRSRTTTRGPTPTAYGSSRAHREAGGGASRCGSARPRSQSRCGWASARACSSSGGASPSAQRMAPSSRMRRTSARVSTSSSATTPRLRQPAAHAGRARRMTTPSRPDALATRGAPRRRRSCR